MAKLAVFIVVSLLGAVAVAAQGGNNDTYPPSPSPQGSPPPALSPPIQASPPIRASSPSSPPIRAPPAPSPASASPPIQQASPPPSTASASPPIQQASLPPSPPIQTPPAPSASPPIQQVSSPPSPPIQQASPPPSTASASPPIEQAPPPPSASPPVQAPPPPRAQGLTVDFYKKSCPRAERIISEVVRKATTLNPGIGGGLIRLAFHDCFVQGCDASVLLDPTLTNPHPEKLGIPNYPSLRGYEVIDDAKAALESACPGVVSCADIVQFAARDATTLLSNGRITFKLAGGRLDGRVSHASETLAHLPPPFFTLPQLIANFNAKGLTADDLVVLSGAHSVGHSHCSSCTGRMTSRSYDAMNPILAGRLRRQCPANRNADDPVVVQDFVTPHRMDNQYYRNVLTRNVLFDSDAELLASDQTKQMVFFNAYNTQRWEQKFAAAMVKMAAIEVKTGASGEVRRNCRVVNSS